jgi:hypothetical protein
MGELLTYGTIRGALVLYGAALVALARHRGATYCGRWPRILWTAAYLLLLVHVGLAFAVFHDWSHAAAYCFTAQETAAVVGLDWGGGLYVNYLFLLVWTADVAWWWLAAAAYQRRAGWLTALIHGFLLFIWFQASVVFAAGISRGLGCGLLLVLVAAVAQRRLRDRSPGQ